MLEMSKILSTTSEWHQNQLQHLTKFPCLFLLAIFASTQAYNYQFIETNMTLYFHDYYDGPNATMVALTGIPGKAWIFNNFGTTYVADARITQKPDKNLLDNLHCI
ncbi:hypothetical protein HYC85_014494 [Camellia sinensis]|uniref:Dirigent protein n=1 Tax=Camellia sinensis TaxID=4442 RepID=A0A7J7H7J6_CAMSI|nr:hypothetical protein HYC85_014494 [Camellia sinensis]